MTKAETLQKYLPCHTTYGNFDLCVECPYNPHPGKIWEYGCAHGQDKMIDDAISMLKEKNDSIGHWVVLENCSNAGVYCSECHTKIFDRYPMKKKYSYFCPHCGTRMEGQAVK